MEQATIHDEKMDNLRSLVKSLQDTVSVTYAKMSVLQEDKDFLIISTHVAVDKARNQLRNERRHTASLMFVIHSQVRPFLFSSRLSFSSLLPFSLTVFLFALSLGPQSYIDSHLLFPVMFSFHALILCFYFHTPCFNFRLLLLFCFYQRGLMAQLRREVKLIAAQIKVTEDNRYAAGDS